MAKKRKDLTITSDVYKALKGAAYGQAYNALEDALDNDIIGLDDPRLSEDHVRNVVIEFYSPNDTIAPTTIKIYDNGIGMSKQTVAEKLYVTKSVDAQTKIQNGGSSRWGLGYKQFCYYLGEPGRVITSEVGEGKPFESQIFYEDGKTPYMESIDITESMFKHEMTPLGDVNHGTMIEITNIDSSKFPKEWWNPSGNTWYKSFQSRYNRLLESGKLKIKLVRYTGSSTDERILSPNVYYLHKRGVTDTTWKQPGGQYTKSPLNQFDILDRFDFDLIDNKILLDTIHIPIKVGKHLSAIQRDVWKELGKKNLICGTPAASAIPTIYVYQNGILLGRIKLKENERDGGIAHLNGMYVELDVPKDYVIPTNTTKNGFDKSWEDELKRQLKPWVEKHESGYPESDVRERAWHDAFEHEILEDNPYAQITRNTVFGETLSVEELHNYARHEKQISSAKPDYTYGEDKDSPRILIEIKDEIADTSSISQVARYYMNRGGNVDRIVLLARGFGDSVVNEFQDWNNSFPNTEFITLNFSDINIDEHKVTELNKKKNLNKLGNKKNEKNVK